MEHSDDWAVQLAHAAGEGAEVGDAFGVPVFDVSAERWVVTLQAARDSGLTFFDWLSAVDELDEGFSVVAHVADQSRHPVLHLSAPDPDPARRTRPAVRHRRLSRRGMARARDPRDVRHRVRRASCARPAAAARRLRGPPVAQGVRAGGAGGQAVAGRQGAGRARRTSSGAVPAPDAAAWRAGSVLGTAPAPADARVIDVVEALVRVVAVVAAFLLLPLLVGQTEHKVMAHMQGRVGPMYAGGFHGWAQLIADGVKFAQKEDVAPGAARTAACSGSRPPSRMIPYLVAMAFVPLGARLGRRRTSTSACSSCSPSWASACWVR